MAKTGWGGDRDVTIRENRLRKVKQAVKDTGLSYVKLGHIEDDLDMKSRVIAQALGQLEDEGFLDAWSKPTASANTYRVVGDEQ